MRCCWCIPGQIMAATALLQVNPSPTVAEMRRGMSGNLCRCANYNHIQAAVLELPCLGPDAMGDGGRIYAMLQPWTDTRIELHLVSCHRRCSDS